MPDFDKLNAAATKLAVLTEPRNRQPGLTTWNEAIMALWEDLVDMWEKDKE